MGDGLLVGANWWIHQQCFDWVIFLYCITLQLRQAIILHALSSSCNTWGAHLAQTLMVVYTHPQWYAAHWQRVNQGQLPIYILVPLNEFLDMHSVDLCHWVALLCSLIVVKSLPDANVGVPLATCCLDITSHCCTLPCVVIGYESPTVFMPIKCPSGSPSLTAVVVLLLCICLESHGTVNTRALCYIHVEYLQLQQVFFVTNNMTCRLFNQPP